MKETDYMNHVNNFGGADNAKKGKQACTFQKGLSAVHVNISFKHTSTRELSELVR